MHRRSLAVLVCVLAVAAVAPAAASAAPTWAPAASATVHPGVMTYTNGGPVSYTHLTLPTTPYV